ncbi:SseB family protein [Actinomyces sp. 2119]|uniref:SseB family protein n=1 Tax=Actinomyces sp. 2119 TaxID=2321393 RepID=UPI002175D722|nr:SseB family protein [Actinomyces sp. 2119]
MSTSASSHAAGPHRRLDLAMAAGARARMERLLAAPVSFRDDDGSVDPDVADALAVPGLPRHRYLDAVWTVLAGSRLLVPVQAHGRPGGPARVTVGRDAVDPPARRRDVPGEQARATDPCQDAATLAVRAPDGRRALPVFTSAEAMRAWRRDVRPVPVTARRAAQVAAAVADMLWALDPGTRDLCLPRPALLALSEGREWVPSWRNDVVQAQIRARLESVEAVRSVSFEPGTRAELRVLVGVEGGGARRTEVQAAGEARDSHGETSEDRARRAVRDCQQLLGSPEWGHLVDTVELYPLPA